MVLDNKSSKNPVYNLHHRQSFLNSNGAVISIVHFSTLSESTYRDLKLDQHT